MQIPGRSSLFLRIFPLLLLIAFGVRLTLAQQPAQKPTEKATEKKADTVAPPENARNPAQFELLETRYRFEANGNSRKEVHAHVHINSELGVRQFARLNFDYNRSFQSIDIPLVHITHPSGGTADILPSAITDNPNPAVVNAPAYQDVRVKSVRILGLAPGDNLEYRVITATTHHPLAPDFWLDHSFDRTGVVSHELFDIDVPASRKVQLYVATGFPYETVESENRTDARVAYLWKYSATAPVATSKSAAPEVNSTAPEIILTTLESWQQLSGRLSASLLPATQLSPAITNRSTDLTQNVWSRQEKAEKIYDFVSQKILTVDLPLGSMGFRGRSAEEILKSGYATQEDKFVLFAALSTPSELLASAQLAGAPFGTRDQLPWPNPFTHLLIAMPGQNPVYWLDPSLEVAPFRMISSSYRATPAFFLISQSTVTDVKFSPWDEVTRDLPDAAAQKVSVDAALADDGKLTAKVHYSLRGDNELLLRVAFHQSPKEKWKDLAQLLSLSDGFRGQVTSVNASDPYATREPFIVDYEISQPKFVDWSKKPVRIPALLPQIGLPDPPAKPVAGTATAPIELGTPLEVETHMRLHLPPGTTVTAPTGTSVQRDYATFASQYLAKRLTVTASRHINFLLRQVPAERAPDYNAFLRAVLNDEAQDFTLDRQSPPAPAAKP